MSVGQKLRQSRTEQNISLRQVADETKIGIMFLDALERDDTDSLPGDVYGKNFLRAYCRFLNLDENAMVEEYQQQFGITPLSTMYHAENERDNQRFLRRRRNLTISICIVFFALVLIAIWLLKTHPVASQTQRDPVAAGEPFGAPATALPTPESDASDSVDRGFVSETPAAVEEDPLAVENSGVAADDGAPDAIEPTQPQLPPLPCFDLEAIVPVDGRPVERLEDVFAIGALEPVWMEVEIDGNRITRRLIDAGSVRFYRYGQNHRVKIGDVSKVSIQDGRTYRQRVSAKPAYPGWIEFGPGEFAETLSRVSQNDASEPQ